MARNPRSKRILFYSTLSAILLLWISGVLGNSGIVQAYRLSQVKRDMALKIVALENEEQRLRASLQALEHDPLVQEQAIRETLGFVRENELVFEFR